MNAALRYFWEIAIFHAIFRLHVLMLVIQVFDRFSETHCRQTGKIKRDLIAAAARAIERGHKLYCLHADNFFDDARELARRRIVVLLRSCQRRENADAPLDCISAAETDPTMSSSSIPPTL